MAKKVFMIAPFEAMTGNLSGDQNLQYAENNNPAYEAPNGTQYARNYRTRYVGARRGKDGLVYFQVKQTTATVLTASTRRTMAIIGVTAAIRSALMSAHATDWSKINQAFDYLKATGRLPEGQDTFNKWFSAQIKDMLVYKRATWSFTYATISFTIHNPYDLASADALVIKQSIWVKFAEFFMILGEEAVLLVLSIDGNVIKTQSASGGESWEAFATTTRPNPNNRAQFAGITYTSGKPLYNGLPLYYNDVQVTGVDQVADGGKYTTADPNI